MYIELSLTGNAVIGTKNGEITFEVTTRKWGLFLTSLAAQQQINGPDVAFDHLYNQATFSQGRKGHKNARTVSVEIDNFRRQMKTAGLNIIKRKHGTKTTYAIDGKTCQVSKTAHFTLRLNQLRGGSDALAFWIKPQLGVQLAWVFASMRAKVAFAQGQISQALAFQRDALALTSDPFLNAATYADVARISYRADRDTALDMRDQAMDFVESGKMSGAIAQIFVPRIQVSYAFQDDIGADVQCQKLDAIAAGYLTHGIDVAGLARALNTRGNMRRRAVNDNAGLHDFQLGIALAITTNDPDLIQASLFNILAALEFSDSVPPEVKIEGAELNEWFCQQYNLGRDSAQAELLHAQFYIEAADFDKADAAIHRAATILSSQRNATDVAFYFYTRANYDLQRHSKLASLRQTLVRIARAEKIYNRVGNIIGTRKIDKLKAKLTQTA